VNQAYFAPAPYNAPVAVRVTLRFDRQTDAGAALTEVTTEFGDTITVMLTHVVVKQAPIALTKYTVVVVGLTEIVLNPDEIWVPVQEPEYQYQSAPSPSTPRDSVRFADDPTQILAGDGEEDIEVAGVEFVLIIKVTEVQVVVLQVPSALTQ
jgi:hypothetical protein